MAVGAVNIQSQDPGAMTPKQKSIVEAAAKLFLERGYGAVSMDAIAAQAVVSKRTVYSYYQNKESLFADVMSSCCEENAGRQGCPLMSEDLITNTLPSEMLQMSGEHVLKIITSDPVREMYRVVTAETDRFPELGKSYYAQGPAWIIDRLTEYLQGEAAKGTLDISDPRDAALKFLGMVTFPIHMEIMTGVKGPVDAAEIEDISKSAVKTFLAAYGKD